MTHTNSIKGMMYDDIFYTEEIIVKGKYGDMLNMPHHQSARHRSMPLADRAMQFGAFAAVAGHDDAVKQSELQAELDAETVYDDEWD